MSIFFFRFFTPAPLSVFLLPSFPAKFPKKENLKPIWIFYIRLLMNHAGMLFCLVFCLCPIYFNDFQLLCLCPTHSNISSHFAYVRFTPTPIRICSYLLWSSFIYFFLVPIILINCSIIISC